jgi:hypothetical protein
MAKTVKSKKAYEIQVAMTVTKIYTVVADSEDEAVEKLEESGIITASSDKNEVDYEQHVEVVRKVKTTKPDLD